jgi:hypothetical protein
MVVENAGNKIRVAEKKNTKAAAPASKEPGTAVSIDHW